MKPQSCLICKLQGKTFKATTLTTTKIQLSAELQTRKKMKDEKVKSFVQVGEVGGVGGGGEGFTSRGDNDKRNKIEHFKFSKQGEIVGKYKVSSERITFEKAGLDK